MQKNNKRIISSLVIGALALGLCISPSLSENAMAASDTADSLCVRRGNTYYFSYTVHAGNADSVIYYGRANDDVLVGDWDGDGKDTLAVRRGNVYYISNTIKSGNADKVIAYGKTTDTVLAGDWDGDSKDSLAVRRGNTYYISNSIKSGNADIIVAYGRATDKVLVGDWDGDGEDTLTVRRGNTYYFSNTVRSGNADKVVAYGKTDDEVYVGYWGTSESSTSSGGSSSNSGSSGSSGSSSSSHTHNYSSEVTAEATCEENGKITYTCGNCGDSYTETVNALDHNWVLQEENVRHSVVTCNVCGSTFNNTTEWRASDCYGDHGAYTVSYPYDDLYECSRCGETKYE